MNKHPRGSDEDYFTSPICQNGVFDKPQQKFLLTLFGTILLACGKINFTNLSRYSELSERTYRRQYCQEFCFMSMNAKVIEAAIPTSATCIGAMDCSFIPKSGKATYGLDWFYNGSASRTQKGLEISVIAVIDVDVHRGYSLSVQQTPAHLAVRQAKAQSQPQRITETMIEQTRHVLEQLPTKTTAQAEANQVAPNPLEWIITSSTSKTVMPICQGLVNK